MISSSECVIHVYILRDSMKLISSLLAFINDEDELSDLS